MRLRRLLRAGVAAAAIAAVAVPPAGLAAPEASRAPASALEVRVGQAPDFSRLEFHWRGGAKMTARRDGQVLILRFSRDAKPDISRLRVGPPKWLKTAEQKHVGGALELWLTLADDADAKTGFADGVSYVTLFEKPAPPPEPAVAAAHEDVERPNPVPAGGVVRMTADLDGKQVLLSFPWANPSGAAVFRRGDAVWVVFDAPASLDVSAGPRGLKQLSGMKAFKGADHAAVRIDSPAAVPVRVAQEGPVWTIALGPGGESTPGLISIVRDDVGGPAGLTAAVAGVTRIVRLTDPVVGDTLTVATALGPAKALPSRREYVQLAFLPTAHGLAFESYADNLLAARRGDLVSIARPDGGLVLSASAARKGRGAALEGAPQPASLPALIDYETWPKTGSGGFLARYHALMDAASEEAAKGKEAPVAARLALARFLVGTELSYEAIGVLNELARTHPQQLSNPEFRGLRGIAKVMARRYQEAATEFAAPALSDDPSSALWRSYIAAQTAQWEEARKSFAAGAVAFNQFSPVWKARFARGDAQAALALGDLASATARVNLALMAKPGAKEDLFTRLLQARLLESQGEKGRALAIYQAVQKAPLEQLAAPALMRATQIRYETRQITPAQAAQVFDGLRFRWRGDATELETIRVLGRLYLDQGRYREALEALRSAGMRLPDLPEALLLQADLAATFRALFLDGMADGLEPIQALALFFDFKELTPIGADGDMMVRRLVRRLVDVDLLGQAAELLDYQANHRLDGVPRAQVATDLALIHLMDRQPEKALAAINASRTTVLPHALNAERRLIEGRALMQLGRFDHALEVLQRDNSSEAHDLRAEVMWRQKDWPGAAAAFERSLGERWKSAAALSADEEGRLLRAGVAYSLAGDNAALARLQGRWGGFYDNARNPEALRVALSGAGSGPLSVAEFGRMTADSEAFTGWVAKMKEKFRQRPVQYAPVQTAKPLAPPSAAAPAPQKQAAAGTATRG